MKASELMQGNLVRYNEFIFQIVGFSNDIALINRGKGDVTIEINELQPIPITADLLPKFGFDLENDFKHPDAPIYFCLVRGKLICFLHNCSHAHINYIHELQNLFFTVRGKKLQMKN